MWGWPKQKTNVTRVLIGFKTVCRISLINQFLDKLWMSPPCSLSKQPAICCSFQWVPPLRLQAVDGLCGLPVWSFWWQSCTSASLCVVCGRADQSHHNVGNRLHVRWAPFWGPRTKGCTTWESLAILYQCALQLPVLPESSAQLPTQSQRLVSRRARLLLFVNQIAMHFFVEVSDFGSPRTGLRHEWEANTVAHRCGSKHTPGSDGRAESHPEWIQAAVERRSWRYHCTIQPYDYDQTAPDRRCT